MSNLDPQLNILWLSDIHYHKDYSDKKHHSELKVYLDSFQDYVKKINKNFDYILLSGDIAQNGAVEDYEEFNKDVLNSIQGSYPKANLIVLPGNHDVSRNAVDFINEFIENKEDLDVFFQKNKEAFYNIFSPYTNKYISDSSLSINNSPAYSKHLLYGHILDKKNKTVFVLLNSAWYSFGDIFLNHYFEKQLQNDKETKTILEEIKKITSEYGYQSLVLDVIEEIDEIITLLNQYPEYLTITIMHHSTNWFIRKDQITRETNKFHHIKNFTDLLLTGHEHVSIEHPIEYINNSKILHIKAGCFLVFSKDNNDSNSANSLNPFKVKNNWFSTLELNTKKRTVKQEKHFFNNATKDWELFQDISLLKLNKKHDVVISDNRLKNIKEQLNSNTFKIIQYLFPSENIDTIKDDIFRFKDSIIFFVSTSNIGVTNDSIKEQYDSAKFQKLYIVFIDLFHELSSEYISGNNRLLVLNKIKSDFDFKFDDFRHKFFSELSENEISIYGRLVFLNKISPYWDIEHLNC